MDLEQKIKEEKKYSKYGVVLFSILIVLQLCAFAYERWNGYNVEFPIYSIIISVIMILCFKYTYSLVYFFQYLNQLEAREVKKAVLAREEKNE